MSRIRLWVLRITLAVIGLGQTALGVLLIAFPHQYEQLYDVSQAPAWTSRLMAVLGVRAAAFGLGMLLVLRNPVRHRTWVIAMIAIQATDALISIVYLAAGQATFAETTPAPIAPLLFLAGLLVGFPRAAAVTSGVTPHPADGVH